MHLKLHLLADDFHLSAFAQLDDAGGLGMPRFFPPEIDNVIDRTLYLLAYLAKDRRRRLTADIGGSRHNRLAETEAKLFRKRLIGDPYAYTPVFSQQIGSQIARPVIMMVKGLVVSSIKSHATEGTSCT